ncbi:MAG: 5'-nucleotidase C-terminal domain-containing protein [Marinibacterium sp.]
METLRPRYQGNRPDRTGVRILCTTDLHMHLRGFSYYGDDVDTTTGLARTATLIRQARQEAVEAGHAVILLDNGDSLQGTPLADMFLADGSGRHPMMAAFAELGYDAIGLGNHDFDFGLDSLSRILADAPCPVVCSNLDGNFPPIVPSATVALPVKGGPILRIGILSVLPPQTSKWNAHHLTGALRFTDMVATAAGEARRLKADGCDIVVALAHSGLSATAPESGAENAVLPIAALPDIDAVIAGHTHLHLPGPDHAGMVDVDRDAGKVHGIPVAMAGSAGSHLGLIDLDLDLRTGSGDRWQPAGSRVSLRPIFQVPQTDGPEKAAGQVTPEDAAIVRLLEPHHAATRRALARPIGHTTEPLHSYFTFFGPDRALALVASAQARAMARAIEDAGLGHLPLLSSAAPCKSGGHGGPQFFTDVPPGPVTLRHAADLHIYADEVRLARLTGAMIADWLEMPASLFTRLTAGADNPELLRPGTPGYGFDVIHGLEYTLDPSQPARFDREGRVIDAPARRVSEIRFGGVPVAPEDSFLVVLNSYRLNGGGNVTALANAEPVAAPAISLRDAIRTHLSDGHGAEYASPWRLASLPGTTVTAATGPGARDYLDEISDLDPVDLGLDVDGFLNLRLTL